MSGFITSLSFALLRLGWAHLSTRPGRTLLTILGVGLGVAAAVAVQRANLDVLASFEQTVLTVAGPTTIEIHGNETGIDERLIAAVRPLPGIQSASPVISQTVVRLEGELQRQAIQVLGLICSPRLSLEAFVCTVRKARPSSMPYLHRTVCISDAAPRRSGRSASAVQWT